MVVEPQALETQEKALILFQFYFYGAANKLLITANYAANNNLFAALYFGCMR